MFWRFGFDNGSSIDSLLDKEEVSLEAILDEDDLLQECKSQNTRLIDYFQRTDVLQRLLGYVTGQIEGEETGRFKYPYVATEVLCSEIWSIVETCLNHTDQLLIPFWETVLDRPPEDMRTEMAMASHFAKINAVFLNKKPAEMLLFIRSQPSIVERLLQHIETPSFADLLVRIIQLDEQPGGAGVLEWLSDEGLMPRLISRLSPSHSPDMHTVVSDLIKSIISMAAPSPGAAITESQNNGPASNRFARELARKSNVQTLVDYMLTDFGPETGSTPVQGDKEADPFAAEVDPMFPNLESCTSSVVQSICIIIELIRQNNSDYFEPYLFHTLRNRLIQVQQSLTTRDPEEGRLALEGAMKEMVDRMGVVHLGPVLEILSEKLDHLHQYLLKPRSLEGSMSTTVGNITPLTFERYRICELFAELLHCSNMSLLNRPVEFNYLYDDDGRLQGGLTALEDLAHVISMGSGDDGDNDVMDEGADEMEPAMELPVHSGAHDDPLLDSDEDMSDGVGPGSSDDDPMEDIAITSSPTSANINIPGPPSSPAPVEPPSPKSSPPTVFSRRSTSPSPISPSMPSVSEVPRRRASNASIGSNSSTRGKRAGGSRRSSRRFTLQDSSQPDVSLPVGEHLKQKLLDAKVLSVVLDLFFDFPWNNFLHSVAYDLIHQILTGRVDVGANRQLAIALFRDAKLMQRIVEGQRRNDAESVKPKGVRLGYMGHLTLISEDVVLAMEHFPPDLRALIGAYAPQPDWDDYINGRYNETKERDASLLGGGKPTVAGGPGRPAGQWKVDEAETVGAESLSANESEGTARGEFKRASSARPTRENSADFGPAPIEDDDDFAQAGHPSFARYLAQEMHSPDEFGSSSGSSSDASDEEDGGWLSRSQFDIDRPPPVSARPHSGERRPLSSNGFDDEFSPGSIAVSSPFSDPFADDDDDGFGPFADSAASDPFTFSSTFSDGMQDSFGDFGEFQGAGDGETTPTAGSWTFASGESPISDDGVEKALEGEVAADEKA